VAAFPLDYPLNIASASDDPSFGIQLDKRWIGIICFPIQSPREVCRSLGSLYGGFWCLLGGIEGVVHAKGVAGKLKGVTRYI
jgi:hypothetical protein